MNCIFFMCGKEEEWAKLGGFVDTVLSATRWERGRERTKIPGSTQ